MQGTENVVGWLFTHYYHNFKNMSLFTHSLNLELLKNIRRMTAECKTVILPLVKRSNLELEETVRKSKS